MEELNPKQETEEEESETPPVESDSERLVMAPRPSKRRQKSETKPGNSVTIAVNHVSLEEESRAMNNDDIKQLFIEYRFLGIDPQETETPFSLPKPKPYHNIQFNFSNTFHVDLKNNYQRRQYLASMLLPSDPDDGRIQFTLVSEPPEDDQDRDCEDVGVAFVSIRDILKNRKDVLDQEIEILDVQDEETVIGGMNLTVACLSALESVEKEMKKETLRSTIKLVKSDTMFGDDPPKDSDEESIEEDITEEGTPGPSQGDTLGMEELSPNQETEEEESETPPVESDSEGLVMAPRPSKRRQKSETKPGNSLTISVNHVSLEEESRAMNNDDIKQLFIEYRFLGIDPQETETPFSLPKPKPYHNIQFNFSNTFHVDFKNNYQRRQYLASMLLPSDPDDGRIRFTLVSEPPEDDQDRDCEDVGVAFVSIRDILKNRKDVLDQEIEILDVQDEETVIGGMNLTVACLSALESVEKEMKVEGT